MINTYTCVPLIKFVASSANNCYSRFGCTMIKLTCKYLPVQCASSDHRCPTFVQIQPPHHAYVLLSATSSLLRSTLSFVYFSMAASCENSNPCPTLASQLPGQVSYAQDATYGASISSYFYQQARLAPQCIVFPKSASDVSCIVKIIVGTRAKAAVRGGGHTPIANAANLDNAVTIDLNFVPTELLEVA